MSLSFALVAFFAGFLNNVQSKDVPCVWKSLTGASYDLRPLSHSTSKDSYYIRDGDIPCTPEEEPSFSYEWNLCADVSPIPAVCAKMGKTSGVALQYLDRTKEDGFYDCYVIGRYDPKKDDLFYTQLDPLDPTKGVSIRYPNGERCTVPGTDAAVLRSATIDVVCDNVDLAVVSAQEPDLCQYHLVMRSYHGCPTSCPIVKGGGLCNGHGLCAYDHVSKSSYCLCNEGYGGDGCTDAVEPNSSTDHGSIQMTLLIVLLLITVILVGVVGMMGYNVQVYRKQQEIAAYSSFTDHSEMVDRGRF